MPAASPNFAVSAAAGGEEALAQAAHNRWDVALLDLNMPGMNGIDMLKQVMRKLYPVPVIVVSAHSTDGASITLKALGLGAFDFVEKPLSLAKLLRVVDRALESGRRKRLATRALIPPLVAPVGKSQLMQGLREQVQQVAEQLRNGGDT